MGVYIDMEMPTDGRYTLCITHDSDVGVHWVFQNQETLEFLKHGAVIEVPESHGDLIDRKELENVVEQFCLEDEHGDLHWWNALMNAPTVIPASEEGET